MPKTVNSNHDLLVFNTYIGPLSGATTCGRVDLGVIAMNKYSAFPKAPALLKPHDQIV